MPLVEFINEDEAPPVVRRIFNALRKAGRRVVNARRIMAHNPKFLRALGPFSEAILQENVLSNRIKELSILRVSLINGCHY
jgi:alkylhydroperoxidase family enzyme